MSRAMVSVIIVAAAVVAAFLILYAGGAWVRAADRLRARRRGRSFAGRAKIKFAHSSLVAPDVARAISDFRVPWLIRALHRATVLPSGVLTVDNSGRQCRVAWEPNDKSRRRGARGWQLEKDDIDRIEENVTVFMQTDVSVDLVDHTSVQLTTGSLRRLRQALADGGIVLEPLGPRRRPLPLPVLREMARRSGEAIEEFRTEHPQEVADNLRTHVRSIPHVTLRRRTWEDVADHLDLTPWEAWQLLKDEPPEELARLGLAGEPPPPPPSHGGVVKSN